MWNLTSEFGKYGAWCPNLGKVLDLTPKAAKGTSPSSNFARNATWFFESFKRRGARLSSFFLRRRAMRPDDVRKVPKSWQYVRSLCGLFYFICKEVFKFKEVTPRSIFFFTRAWRDARFFAKKGRGDGTFEVFGRTWYGVRNLETLVASSCRSWLMEYKKFRPGFLSGKPSGPFKNRSNLLRLWSIINRNHHRRGGATLVRGYISSRNAWEMLSVREFIEVLV